MRDVEFRRKVSAAYRLDHLIVLHKAQGRTIIGLIRPAAESNVMVLHEAYPRNGILKISIKPFIYQIISPLADGSAVAIRREHLELLVNQFGTGRDIIANVKIAQSAFFCFHDDYTRSTSTTILRRLARIFQNLKALNVGGKDVAQRRQVSIDPIYNYQRIVAARQ